MKVKILEAKTSAKLEKKVNEYLETVDSKFHEFLYQHTALEKYSVMIVTIEDTTEMLEDTHIHSRNV